MILQNDYAEYVQYTSRGQWKKTKFHRYLCEAVQSFIETDTGHAADILVLSVPPQHGKLIADSTPVLTKDGWKTHGELVIGDYVLSHKGKWVKVTNILPKDYADRKVTTTDGEEILVHAKHEWLVYDRYSHKETVRETEHIEKRIWSGNEKGRGHRYNYMLPNREPLDCEDKPLAVDPYVLGVWLGDGTTTQGQICAAECDRTTIDTVRTKYPDGAEWTHKDTGVITASFKGLYKDLQQYGMCRSKGAAEKHIPVEYITASKKQRLELLAGLIDTDGYADLKHNRIVFTTSGEELKNTFEDLIATFGWRTTTCECRPVLSSSGIQGKNVYWQIGFNPTEHIPCKLERKQMNIFSKQRRIAIKSIEKVKPEQGNCITVEGGIYCVGRKMIPTHNSVTITESLVSWYMGKHPNHSCIIASYNTDFAERFGRRNKEKIEQYGEAIFGISVGGKSSNQEFELDGTAGRCVSRGMLSGITGNSGHLIIIDDPLKTREEAYSQTTRDKLWEEWSFSIKSRYQDVTKVVVIMTRWHDDDLAGRIIRNENNVTVLNLPLEAEENDPLGRKVGDSLCPELGKDNAWVKEFKEGFLKTEGGTMAWNALMQGHPTSEDGNMLKREWWQYYDELPECGDWLMSVDATFKDGDDNDYVAIQVWGKRDANMYLIDRVKKHLDFPSTLREIRRLRGLYPKVKQVLIEDKANGSAAIQVLRREMHGVIGINPQGGKVSRVNAVSGAIESGNVWLPKNKAWTHEFVDECAAFPNGVHDDEVDCCSQALTRFMYYRGKVPEMIKKKKTLSDVFNMGTKRKRLDIGDRINVV